MLANAIKFIMWPCPIAEPGLHKYVVVGVVVSDTPLPAPQGDQNCVVLEGLDNQAEELIQALAAMDGRPAKHQGRDANSYLRELGEQ